MDNTVTLQFDLNRQKAIDLIIRDDSTMTLHLSIDCDASEEELKNYLDGSEGTIDSFIEDCKEHRKKLLKKRKELDQMMTHEIYELGEKRGLWKQVEKQLRLC